MNSLSMLEASARLVVLQTEYGRKLLRFSKLGDKDKTEVRARLCSSLDTLNTLLTSSESVMLQTIAKDLDSFANLQDSEYILLESAKSLRRPYNGKIESRWVLASKLSCFEEVSGERRRAVIAKITELRQLVRAEQQLLLQNP